MNSTVRPVGIVVAVIVRAVPSYVCAKSCKKTVPYAFAYATVPVAAVDRYIASDAFVATTVTSPVPVVACRPFVPTISPMPALTA